MPKALPSTTRSLPISLIRAREQVAQPIREMLLEEGISEQQWRVLRILDELGPQTASHICDRAGIMRPSFTRISGTMVDKGFVIRARNNRDKRSAYFAITAAGRAVIERNHAHAQRLDAAQKARIGAKRYEMLLDLLDELADDLPDR